MSSQKIYCIGQVIYTALAMLVCITWQSQYYFSSLISLKPIAQLQIFYIRTCFPFASQILREVIDHPPVIILIIVIKMMTFSRYDQHIKAFARLDQLVHDNNGIRRMHIIIDIAMDQ